MVLVLITFLSFHRESITAADLIYLLLQSLNDLAATYVWRWAASDALLRFALRKGGANCCNAHVHSVWPGCSFGPAVLLWPSLGQLRPSQLSTWAWKVDYDHGDTQLSSESSKKKCFVLFLREKGNYRALPIQ